MGGFDLDPELAKRAGILGGEATKKKGSDYYSRIGKIAASMKHRESRIRRGVWTDEEEELYLQIEAEKKRKRVLARKRNKQRSAKGGE